MRNFHPPPSGQVTVEVKFFLKLQSLLAGVSSAGPLGYSSIVTGIDWERGRQEAIHRQASRCYMQVFTVQRHSFMIETYKTNIWLLLENLNISFL